MPPWFQTLALVIFFLHVVKSLTVGSDFCFHCWKKYGRRYTDWYFDRKRRFFECRLES